VIWLGDIFDHPASPLPLLSRRATRLGRHPGPRVPTVVISGNHDTPRLPGRGSPYSALADTFRRSTSPAASPTNVRHHGAGERGRRTRRPSNAERGGDARGPRQAGASRSGDRTNLLITHPRIKQLEPKHADINEIEIDLGTLESDLVLLGTTTSMPGDRGHLVRRLDGHLQLRR